MASFLYDAGRNAFARGDIAWKASGGSTMKLQALDLAEYTADGAVDANLSDIPGAARVGDPATLALLDPVAGVCDAADTQLPGAEGGTEVGALVGYLDSGVEATSTLIFYLDTATGLPFVTNDAPVDIVWSNGAHKIFKL